MGTSDPAQNELAGLGSPFGRCIIPPFHVAWLNTHIYIQNKGNFSTCRPIFFFSYVKSSMPVRNGERYAHKFYESSTSISYTVPSRVFSIRADSFQKDDRK